MKNSRGNSRGFSIIKLLILIFLGAVLFFGYRASQENTRNEEIMFSELESASRQLSESQEIKLDEQGNLTTSKLVLDTTPKAGGDIGKLESLAKTFFNEKSVAGNEYVARINEIGLARFLDIPRIQQDVDFEQSRQMLAQARQALDNYKAQTKNVILSFHERVFNLDISEESKQGLLRSLDPQRTIRLAEQAVLSESHLFDEYDKLINFLEAKKGQWTLDSDRFMFKSDQDLAEFQRYITNIWTIANEAASSQQQIEPQGAKPGEQDNTAIINRFALDTIPEADGNSEKLDRLEEEVFNEIVAIANEYSASFTEPGLIRFFDAQRLLQDTDFEQSREILARARRATDKHGAQMKKLLILRVPERVADLDVSEKEKQELLRSFKAHELMQKVERTVLLDNQILDEFDKSINFLEAKKGQWKLDSDQQIMFESEQDLAEYKRYIANVLALNANKRAPLPAAE